MWRGRGRSNFGGNGGHRSQGGHNRESGHNREGGHIREGFYKEGNNSSRDNYEPRRDDGYIDRNETFIDDRNNQYVTDSNHGNRETREDFHHDPYRADDVTFGVDRDRSSVAYDQDRDNFSHSESKVEYYGEVNIDENLTHVHLPPDDNWERDRRDVHVSVSNVTLDYDRAYSRDEHDFRDQNVERYEAAPVSYQDGAYGQDRGSHAEDLSYKSADLINNESYIEHVDYQDNNPEDRSERVDWKKPELGPASRSSRLSDFQMNRNSRNKNRNENRFHHSGGKHDIGKAEGIQNARSKTFQSRSLSGNRMSLKQDSKDTRRSHDRARSGSHHSSDRGKVHTTSKTSAQSSHGKKSVSQSSNIRKTSQSGHDKRSSSQSTHDKKTSSHSITNTKSRGSSATASKTHESTSKHSNKTDNKSTKSSIASKSATAKSSTVSNKNSRSSISASTSVRKDIKQSDNKISIDDKSTKTKPTIGKPNVQRDSRNSKSGERKSETRRKSGLSEVKAEKSSASIGHIHHDDDILSIMADDDRFDRETKKMFGSSNVDLTLSDRNRRSQRAGSSRVKSESHGDDSFQIHAEGSGSTFGDTCSKHTAKKETSQKDRNAHSSKTVKKRDNIKPFVNSVMSMNRFGKPVAGKTDNRALKQYGHSKRQALAYQPKKNLAVKSSSRVTNSFGKTTDNLRKTTSRFSGQSNHQTNRTRPIPKGNQRSMEKSDGHTRSAHGQNFNNRQNQGGETREGYDNHSRANIDHKQNVTGNSNAYGRGENYVSRYGQGNERDHKKVDTHNREGGHARYRVDGKEVRREEFENGESRVTNIKDNNYDRQRQGGNSTFRKREEGVLNRGNNFNQGNEKFNRGTRGRFSGFNYKSRGFARYNNIKNKNFNDRNNRSGNKFEKFRNFRNQKIENKIENLDKDYAVDNFDESEEVLNVAPIDLNVEHVDSNANQQQVIFIPNTDMHGIGQPQFMDQFGNVILNQNPDFGVQQGAAPMPYQFAPQNVPVDHDTPAGEQLIFIPFNQLPPGFQENAVPLPVSNTESIAQMSDVSSDENIIGETKPVAGKTNKLGKTPLTRQQRAKIRSRLFLKQKARLEKAVEKKLLQKLLSKANQGKLSLDTPSQTKKTKPVLKRITGPESGPSNTKKLKLSKQAKKTTELEEVSDDENKYDEVSDYEDVTDDDEDNLDNSTTRENRRAKFRKPGQPRIGTTRKEDPSRTTYNVATQDDVRRVVDKNARRQNNRNINVVSDTRPVEHHDFEATRKRPMKNEPQIEKSTGKQGKYSDNRTGSSYSNSKKDNDDKQRKSLEKRPIVPLQITVSNDRFPEKKDHERDNKNIDKSRNDESRRSKYTIDDDYRHSDKIKSAPQNRSEYKYSDNKEKYDTTNKQDRRRSESRHDRESIEKDKREKESYSKERKGYEDDKYKESNARKYDSPDRRSSGKYESRKEDSRDRYENERSRKDEHEREKDRKDYRRRSSSVEKKRTSRSPEKYRSPRSSTNERGRKDSRERDSKEYNRHDSREKRHERNEEQKETKTYKDEREEKHHRESRDEKYRDERGHKDDRNRDRHHSSTDDRDGKKEREDRYYKDDKREREDSYYKDERDRKSRDSYDQKKKDREPDKRKKAYKPSQGLPSKNKHQIDHSQVPRQEQITHTAHTLQTQQLTPQQFQQVQGQMNTSQGQTFTFQPLVAQQQSNMHFMSANTPIDPSLPPMNHQTPMHMPPVPPPTLGVRPDMSMPPPQMQMMGNSAMVYQQQQQPLVQQQFQPQQPQLTQTVMQPNPQLQQTTYQQQLQLQQLQEQQLQQQQQTLNLQQQQQLNQNQQFQVNPGMAATGGVYQTGLQSMSAPQPIMQQQATTGSQMYSIQSNQQLQTNSAGNQYQKQQQQPQQQQQQSTLAMVQMNPSQTTAQFQPAQTITSNQPVSILKTTSSGNNKTNYPQSIQITGSQSGYIATTPNQALRGVLRSFSHGPVNTTKSSQIAKSPSTSKSNTIPSLLGIQMKGKALLPTPAGTLHYASTGQIQGQKNQTASSTLSKAPVGYEAKQGTSKMSDNFLYDDLKVEDDDDDLGELLCSKCDRTFLSDTIMRKHSLWHDQIESGYNDMNCDSCEQAFMSSGQLNNHFAEKHSANSWNCTVCDITFPNSNALGKHMRNASHCRSMGNKFKCSQCRATFKFLKQLILHKTDHHPEGSIYSRNDKSNTRRY